MNSVTTCYNGDIDIAFAEFATVMKHTTLAHYLFPSVQDQSRTIATTMPMNNDQASGLLTVLKPVFDAIKDGELGVLVAVMDAVASELTAPLVELGVTVAVVAFDSVPLEVPLPTTLVPLAPKRLNSATVAPNSSPVA